MVRVTANWSPKTFDPSGDLAHLPRAAPARFEDRDHGEPNADTSEEQAEGDQQLVECHPALATRRA